MSLDLHVIAAGDRPLTGRELKDALRSRGWSVRLLDELAKRPIGDEDGPLEDDVVIVGWRSDAAEAATLDEIVTAGSIDRLNKEYADSAGSCALSPGVPFEYEELWEGDEFLDEAEEEAPGREAFESEAPADVVAYLRRARSVYNVRTTSGRNRHSSRLQDEVWQAIARLTGGLVEDDDGFRFAEGGRV